MENEYSAISNKPILGIFLRNFNFCAIKKSTIVPEYLLVDSAQVLRLLLFGQISVVVFTASGMNIFDKSYSPLFF